MLCWDLNGSGKFDTRSFYHKIRTAASSTFPWKGIWKVKVLKRKVTMERSERSLSREEKEELVRSKKKVKAVSHAGFCEGHSSGSSSPIQGGGVVEP